MRVEKIVIVLFLIPILIGTAAKTSAEILAVFLVDIKTDILPVILHDDRRVCIEEYWDAWQLHIIW
jgi:hypothetical protein